MNLNFQRQREPRVGGGGGVGGFKAINANAL